MSEFKGTGISLFADTSFAMAQLRALEAYGRRIREGLAGMPAVPGPSTSSPLLAPRPSGAIPGGRIDTPRLDVHTPASISATRSTLVAVPAPAPHVANAEPSGAAAKRAQGIPEPSAPSLHHSGGQAASFAAESRSFRPKMPDIGGRPVLTQHGVNLGPLSIGAGAATLRSVALKSMGPVAVYAGALFAAQAAAVTIGNTVESILNEAELKRRDVGDVIKDRLFNLPGAIGAKIVEGFGGIIADIGEGTAIGLFARSTGDVKAIREIARGWRENLSDFGNTATGGKPAWQLRQEAKADRDRFLARERYWALEKATAQAQEDARKTSEQLLGMGFPGTLDDLNDIAKRAYMDKYEKDIDDKFNSLDTEGIVR